MQHSSFLRVGALTLSIGLSTTGLAISQGESVSRTAMPTLSIFEANRAVMVQMTGQIIDSLTSKPVAATLIFKKLPAEDNIGIYQIDGQSGQYDLALLKDVRYNFKVKAFDYWPADYQISGLQASATKDFKLRPVAAVGETMPLQELLFDNDEYVISKSSYDELDKLTDIMMDNNRLAVQIEGHTDVRGTPETNLRLSENRATAVRDYLLTRGIEKNRIKTKGFGSSQPVLKYSDPSNRRVEVRVLAK